MISIVERLRSYVRANESEAMGMSPCGLCENAADEIERLIEARQVRDKHIDALKAERDALAKDVERLRAEIAGTRKALEHEQFARQLAESQRDALAKRWKDLADWVFYSDALPSVAASQVNKVMRDMEAGR